MRTENDGLATARRDLRLLRSKRNQLQAQLDQSATVLPGSDPTAADNLPANSLDARIRDYESQLDLALLEYTERHPDVIALRETLDLLKAQREAQLAAMGLEGSDLELYTLSANPVRQALQIEMNDTEVEIATLEADIEDRTERVTELQGLINELPQVEAELAQLNRDYEVIYEQYLALVRSREAQGLTLKATTDTREADFRVIDPPLATLDPVGPPRKLMYIAVVIGAIFAGALLCYGCAQLWPIFSTARALRRDIGLPVLGTVSHAWSERYAATVRASSVQFALALALLFVGCGVLVGLETMGIGLHSLLLGGAS
jgi:polysaccharide chain length determinant protein (PEP-CTERM system associated)